MNIIQQLVSDEIARRVAPLEEAQQRLTDAKAQLAEAQANVNRLQNETNKLQVWLNEQLAPDWAS